MNNVMSNLKAFNRKKHFFLGIALGNPDFNLCKEFKDLINKALRWDIPKNILLQWTTRMINKSVVRMFL